METKKLSSCFPLWKRLEDYVKALKRYKILPPRLDWLTVVGDTPHLNYLTDKKTQEFLDNLFEHLNIPFYKQLSRRVYFNPETGIEIAFQKKRTTGEAMISVTFKGHACLESNETMKTKVHNLIKQIWGVLGIETPPKVTRFDIAIDILSAKVTDILPNLGFKRYTFSGKGKTKIKHQKFYANPDEPSLQTGMRVHNSRFTVTAYERLLTLNLRQRKQVYLDYYKELYGDADNVLRIETRLNNDANTEYFTKAFFLSEKLLGEILRETLANFSYHHRIYDENKFDYVKNWDQLFFHEEAKNMKTLKKELDLKEEFLAGPLEYTNHALMGSLRKVAKAMVNRNATSPIAVALYAKHLEKMIIEEKRIKDAADTNKAIAQRLFDIDPERVEEQRMELAKIIAQYDEEERSDES